MGRTWGRLYLGTRNHRKIKTLRRRHPGSWKTFYLLLEMALETDDNGWIYLEPGQPYPLEELADEVDETPEDLQALLCTMVDLGMIQVNGQGIQFLSYSERQFKSDADGAERVRRHREAKKANLPETLQNSQNESTCNSDVTLQDHNSNGCVTPPETETETELGTSPSGDVVDGRAAPSVNPSPSRNVCFDVGPTGEGKPQDDTHIKATAGGAEAQAVDVDPAPEVLDGDNGEGVKTRFTPNDLGRLWNETANPVFPRVILPLSEKRARKFRPAVRARPDPEWWKALFDRAGGISFLRGENDRGWRADLEFVVRRWEDILEGKYDRAEPYEEPARNADPDCKICHGDGWEYVEKNGDRWAKPCRCTTKAMHGHDRLSKSRSGNLPRGRHPP